MIGTLARPPQRWSNSDLLDSSFIIVTGHASTHTKSTWQELEASVPFDCCGILLDFRNANSGPVDFLMDIGFGAAASEAAVLSNIMMSEGVTFNKVPLVIPLCIPAGTRLSARIQQSTGAKGMHLGMQLIAGSGGYQRSATWGANTGDSGGVSIDPGASINTKSGWFEVVASAGFDVKFIIVSFGNRANAAETTAAYLLDIGVGAALSEAVLIPNLSFIVDTATDAPTPGILAFPVSIPAGSRVAVRVMSSTNDATDRLKDVSIVALG